MMKDSTRDPHPIPSVSYKLGLHMLAFLLCFAALATPARALDQSLYEDAEIVGFAYYHLAEKNPPLENWIHRSELYQTIPQSRREEYFQKKLDRLRHGFRMYLPDQHLIDVKANVQIYAPEPEQQNPNIPAEFSEHQPLYVRLADVDGAFLPYKVGGDWIALIPQGFEVFETLLLSEREYGTFSNSLQFRPYARVRPAMLRMKIRPMQADTKQPMQLGQELMWLLLGEIASFEIWDPDEREMLWSYSANWYVPQTHKDLLNLYRR